MIRFSRMADYGVVLLSEIARSHGLVRSAAELAAATQLPAPTASQVLKRLSHGGLLVASRGPHGGYVLARPAASITVTEIVSALDGPIALADCLEGDGGVCDLESFCQVRAPWRVVSSAVRDALDNISLHDMAMAGLPAWAHTPADRPGAD